MDLGYSGPWLYRTGTVVSTERIVAKRCVLEQVTIDSQIGNRKSYLKSIVTKMNDLDLCLEVVYWGHVNHCFTFDVEIFRKAPEGNCIWAIKWSRDRWRHVTTKVLWGSTVGYPSDSLASCLFYARWQINMMMMMIYVDCALKTETNDLQAVYHL